MLVNYIYRYLPVTFNDATREYQLRRRMVEMANTKQAEKRARQNDQIHAHQKAQRTSMRSAMRKVENAVKENAENSQELLNRAIKALDMSVSKGLIHKNKAAREKSRLQRLVNNQ